jgi:uncharacterized protein (DUF2141 family)
MNRHPLHRIVAGLAAGLMLGLAGSPALATELTVRVSAPNEPGALVGCLLFKGPEGFPMQVDRAQAMWLAASTVPLACRFSDLAPGRYAVAVVLDRNANRRVDTGFKGMPVEPWGLSMNQRPLLREPRFDEAAFTITAGDAERTLDVRVR